MFGFAWSILLNLINIAVILYVYSRVDGRF
jgi:hypothetical protein